MSLRRFIGDDGRQIVAIERYHGGQWGRRHVLASGAGASHAASAFGIGVGGLVVVGLSRGCCCCCPCRLMSDGTTGTGITDRGARTHLDLDPAVPIGRGPPGTASWTASWTGPGTRRMDRVDRGGIVQVAVPRHVVIVGPSTAAAASTAPAAGSILVAILPLATSGSGPAAGQGVGRGGASHEGQGAFEDGC